MIEHLEDDMTYKRMTEETAGRSTVGVRKEMGCESLLGAWGMRRAASAGSFPAIQAAGVTVQKAGARAGAKVGFAAGVASVHG